MAGADQQASFFPGPTVLNITILVRRFQRNSRIYNRLRVRIYVSLDVRCVLLSWNGTVRLAGRILGDVLDGRDHRQHRRRLASSLASRHQDAVHPAPPPLFGLNRAFCTIRFYLSQTGFDLAQPAEDQIMDCFFDTVEREDGSADSGMGATEVLAQLFEGLAGEPGALSIVTLGWSE